MRVLIKLVIWKRNDAGSQVFGAHSKTCTSAGTIQLQSDLCPVGKLDRPGPKVSQRRLLSHPMDYGIEICVPSTADVRRTQQLQNILKRRSVVDKVYDIFRSIQTVNPMWEERKQRHEQTIAITWRVHFDLAVESRDR